jgi:U4/U6.U5 tri-snRNP-associated protein 2
LPDPPLFKGAKTPNAPSSTLQITDLLKKFDGRTQTISDGTRKTMKIRKLPKFLLIFYKRKYTSQFSVEKNSMICTFPLSELDLGKSIKFLTIFVPF